MDVAEEDDESLVRGEGGEGVLEEAGELQTLGALVQGFAGLGEVGGSAGGPEGGVEGEGGAGAAAELVVAGVDGDAEEPGAEGAAAEGGEGAEGGDEGVLGGVLGGLSAGEEAEAEVVDGSLVGLDQPVEGVEVALAAAVEEGLLVAEHASEAILTGRGGEGDETEGAQGTSYRDEGGDCREAATF